MIRAKAARYPISAQCRIPDVPRSTYYWMTGHPETERVDSIAGDVRAIWHDSRERYGARKIKAALERKGCHRVQETHRQHHARTGHDERVRARTIRTAQDAGRRGQAREPAGPAGPTATPRTRIWRAILPMSASAGGGLVSFPWGSGQLT